MKELTIKNFGPIKNASLKLSRINVVIGPQSSGKSCVLKLACYCTWVEKRIEITQNPEFFNQDEKFVNELLRFHKLQGYAKDDFQLEYESDNMHFSYEHHCKRFSFKWKKQWNYKRSKVTYIPAERNLVAAIPNWFEVRMADDNIRSFMSDWETARRATREALPVLNLNISYRYDPATHSDKVMVSEDQELDFTNTSSGLQSLIPLFVHLHYISSQIGIRAANESIEQSRENENIKALIDAYLESKHPYPAPSVVAEDLGGDTMPDKTSMNRFFSASTHLSLELNNPELYAEMHRLYQNYTVNQFCDIFLEEPEENLFPPTQSRLIDWLLDMAQGEQACHLFVATHSPYVVTSFLEKKNVDLALFFVQNQEGGNSIVKQASDEEIQEIYAYGVDVFFNIESFE